MKPLFPFTILFGLAKSTIVSAQCSFTIPGSVTNVSRYNGTTGFITVNVSGGTTPYQYQHSLFNADGQPIESGSWIGEKVIAKPGDAWYLSDKAGNKIFNS